MIFTDNNNESRNSERYKSCIPVLIQKKNKLATRECTLIDLSIEGFAVRLENGSISINLNEEFLLIVDPKLFNIDEENKIKIHSICKRVNSSTFVLGATYTENTEVINNYIKIMVDCFKKINENLY